MIGKASGIRPAAGMAGTTEPPAAGMRVQSQAKSVSGEVNAPSQLMQFVEHQTNVFHLASPRADPAGPASESGSGRPALDFRNIVVPVLAPRIRAKAIGRPAPKRADFVCGLAGRVVL